MNTKKLFAILLLGVAIVLGVYGGTLINNMVLTSTSTQDFQLDASDVEFEITDNQKHYIYLRNVLTNLNSDDYINCNISYTDTSSLVVCDSDSFPLFEDFIELEIYNKTLDQYYYINDMGSTSIQMNDYQAIGTINFDSGEYAVTIIDTSYHSESFIRFQDTSMIGSTILLVFVAIGFIGSIITSIVLYVLTLRVSKNSDDEYAYYDSQINKQDHNQELYDEDDPFSIYDK